MVKCFNCGNINDDGSKFCSKCGSSLIDSNTYDYQQGSNDPRRIENPHPISSQQGNNDPRRIENPHPINSQQQNTNQNNNYQQNEKITDKISNLSTPVKIIGLIALCCIGIMIVGALGGGTSDQGSLPSSNNNYEDNSHVSVFDSFNKNDCKEVNYKELNKNPDKYYGDNIKLKGRVMQISEGNKDYNYLLMYVNGDYNQLAYVEYYNDTNIVEDDWITVYGVCAGSYTYTTSIGGTNTVPSMYGAILEK